MRHAAATREAPNITRKTLRARHFVVYEVSSRLIRPTMPIWRSQPSCTAKSMRFDMTDLSLFRHIVEAGSITHGAERAHLPLGAASTRIRKLELAFGRALLVPGRQGVTRTQAGRTLLQHARGILAQSERLQEDLSPYARGLAGQVRVLSNTNAL